ncbi:unnamed protein product, partial [Iphiclides podalirius]
MRLKKIMTALANDASGGAPVVKISGEGRGMVLEGALPLQLYAAAAQLAPRPAWPPFLPFFGVPPPFLARPRLPQPLVRAPHGPPSEDSNEDGASTKGQPRNRRGWS